MAFENDVNICNLKYTELGLRHENLLNRNRELEEVFTRVKRYSEEQNDWVLSGLLNIKGK